jgi:xylose isomerase
MNSAFPNITKIRYEGTKSKNPLAFKHYNPARREGGGQPS